MSKQKEVLQLILNKKKASIIHLSSYGSKPILTVGGVYIHHENNQTMLYYLDSVTGRLNKRSVKEGTYTIEVTDSSPTFFKEVLERLPKTSRPGIEVVHLEELKDTSTTT